ncbi:MAG: hypothetical protein N2595_10935 [bacterium]|nr:hypothetical protein [bacterium]
MHTLSFAGCVRTSPEYLATLLHTRPNQPYEPHILNKDIKTLTALPDIADVVVTSVTTSHGVELTFAIREAPLIATLSATRDTPGRRLPRRPLARLLPGNPFSRTALFATTRELHDYFHRHHYHAVSITSTVTFFPNTNLVSIYLHVHEGTQQFVSTVTFHGNRAFTTYALRRMLHCSPRNRWFLRSGAFSPAQLVVDRERILAAYHARGYLDASVTIATHPLASPAEYALVVHISEGPQYTLGSLTWRSHGLASNHLAQLHKALSFDSSIPYSPDLPNIILERIAYVSRSAGFPPPHAAVRAFISPESSPAHPRVALFVSLSKAGPSPNAPRPLITYPLFLAISP